MSIIPELLFQRAFRDGFIAIRKDPRIIDALFKNLTQEDQAQVREFVMNKFIDFSINYPRADIKSPALVLLLKQESEAQTFLGDQMGTPPFYETPDTDISFNLDGSQAGTTTTLQGLPRKLGGPIHVISQQITNGAVYFYVNDDVAALLALPAIPDLDVYVVGGTGKGQTRKIVTLYDNFLTTFIPFDPPLDATSQFDIRATSNSGAALGEPSQVYDQQGKGVARIGANFETTYQLDILGGSQEETIYLTVIVKAILFAQKKMLEEQGIMAMKLSASDLAPRPEFLPDTIYQRALIMTFTYPFHFLIDVEVFKWLRVNLIPHDPLTGINPNEAVVSTLIPL